MSIKGRIAKLAQVNFPSAQTAWRKRGASGKRTMKPDSDYPTIETLAAAVAHSQIFVAQPHNSTPSLPGGFDDVDIAVLDWIAAEGRRLGRRLLQM